jgi:Fe-S-cluster-containing dehydrogenase component
MLAMPLSAYARDIIKKENKMDRRKFLKNIFICVSANTIIESILKTNPALGVLKSFDSKKNYGMGIEVSKCIGCGKCMLACKEENDVPKDPFYFRTWVERYIIKTNQDVFVENIGNGNRLRNIDEKEILRSFFVPKLCNHCAHPPCVQVCPVGATFSTEDGAVLVDDKRCIGCRYCIQACPYGARYLHPVKKTADKCTFCYHRLAKGLLPACVEVCPVQAIIY